MLEGRIRDEEFAADLSQVLQGTAPELYKNPAVFFVNTYPTKGLRDLFLAMVDRLTGGGWQPTGQPVQLAGLAGYEPYRNSDRFGAAPPGAETLRELIDELASYMCKIKGPAAGQPADQLTPFLTDPIKAVA